MYIQGVVVSNQMFKSKFGILYILPVRRLKKTRKDFRYGVLLLLAKEGIIKQLEIIFFEMI